MISLLIDGAQLHVASRQEKKRQIMHGHENHRAQIEHSSFILQANMSLAANLQETRAAIPVLQHAPKENVQVMIAGNFTFVPISDFQEEDCKTIYEYCFPPKENDAPLRIMYDTIPSAGTVIIFAAKEEDCLAIETEITADVHYMAAMTPILRHITSHPVPTTTRRRRLYVYCHPGRIEVVVTDKSRLQMANTYTTLSDDDVAYYVLSVAQNLGLSFAEDTFYIGGEKSTQNRIISRLSQFVRNVVCINPAEEFDEIEDANTNIPYEIITLML